MPRPNLTSALPLLFALLAPPARADVVQCGGNVPPGVICLTLNVSDTAGGGPLLAGQVYHLSGFVNVPNGETLTVEQGAILKFHPNAQLEVRGTLDCSQGAIFTSLYDDMEGGDTNGDGNASVPAPGDWGAMIFFANSDASRLEQATVKYAEIGVDLRQADIRLVGTEITDCSRPALDLTSSSFPIVDGCSFDRNDFAVFGVPLTAVPGFTGNSATANTKGDYMLITADAPFTANVTIGPNNSLGNQPLVSCRGLTIPAGLTLTLLPGTVFKFGPAPYLGAFGCTGIPGFFVEGTLLATQVSLTSLQDDTVLGDTNKDGNLSIPAPADWAGLRFAQQSDASALTNVLVRYAGQATQNPFIGPSIDLNLADVLLDGVVVRDGPAEALRLNMSSFPTVTGCVFQDHAGVAVTRVAPAAVAGFTLNTAGGNAGDYIQLLTGPATVDGPVTILAENALNGDGVFVVSDSLTIAAAATLTLGEGVALKWKPGAFQLLAQGTLLANGLSLLPVVFTTLEDDAVGGDTNKDGAASQPSPGDWTGLVLMPGSTASVLQNAVVRFAGRADQSSSAVLLSATSATLTGCVVERSETAALNLTSTAFPTVTGCRFDDNERAVINAPIAALAGFDGNSASGNALGDYVRITQGDVSFGAGPTPGGSLTLGPSNALLPDQVFVVATDIDVPLRWVFSLLAGSIVKWDGDRRLDVDGSVQVGGIGNTVVLTSIDDDSIGGDTLEDGSTEGTPGDWQGVFVREPGSYFEDVLIRFAGSLGPAFELIDAAATLKELQVEDCSAAALDLNGTSLPVMDACSFERNLRAVVGVPLRALPGFSNNSAQDNTLGDYLTITNGSVPFDVLVRPSQSLDGRPFVLAANVQVLASTNLCVDPGVVFKADGDRVVIVDGTLECLGAPGSIVFTTLTDDIAGDTNKDGESSQPSPGSWRGLDFDSDSDASVVQGVRVRYAGSAGKPALRLFQSDAKILDTTVESSGAVGLSLSGNSFPELQRCDFRDGLGVPVNFVPLGAVQRFSANLASGNVPGDYVRVTAGSNQGDAIVSPEGSLNRTGVFVVAVPVAVGPMEHLTLRQGTIFKWEGFARDLRVLADGTLTVEGTGFEPVVLTSLHDDAFGGDTLEDGAANLPAPGDWRALTVDPNAAPSSIEHLRVRYAGNGDAALHTRSPQATVRSVRADHAQGDGLRCSALAGAAENWVAFQCGASGIRLAGGTFDLVHPTVAGCQGPGVRRDLGHVGALHNGNLFGNAGGEVTGFAVGEVFSSNAGPTFDGVDGNISVDPLFSDAAAGDLSLAAGSPCIGQADTAVALGVPKDHREASRILDADLDGQARPDMGAFERAAFELTFGGEPRVGTEMTFTVTGTRPGIALFWIGPLGGELFEDPFGFRLHGAQGASAFLGSAAAGQAFRVDMPPPGVGLDQTFGVQALTIALGRPTGALGSPGMRLGNWTNLYRGRLLQ